MRHTDRIVARRLTRHPGTPDQAAEIMPDGYGAMRDVPLDLDPRIDLTQPIYEQVLRLQAADGDGDN